jgi:hypothetical protein
LENYVSTFKFHEFAKLFVKAVRPGAEIVERVKVLQLNSRTSSTAARGGFGAIRSKTVLPGDRKVVSVEAVAGVGALGGCSVEGEEVNDERPIRLETLDLLRLFCNLCSFRIHLVCCMDVVTNT